MDITFGEPTPLAAKRINTGIEDYLVRHGLRSVTDLVGRLDLSGTEDTPASG